jgi:hypothetical protein
VTRIVIKQRVAATVSVPLVLAVLVTSCASRDTGANQLPSAHPKRDVRLLGTWHVATADVVGGRTLHADDSTTASLRFRRDGRLIVNGEDCPSLHFTTDARRIHVQWPSHSVCNYYDAGSRVALRITNIVDNLVGRAPITYTLHGDTRLTVASARYRVELLRGPVPGSSPNGVGPSSPVR